MTDNFIQVFDAQDIADKQPARRANAIEIASRVNSVHAIEVLHRQLLGEAECGLLSLEDNPIWEQLKTKAAQLQSELEAIQAAADANLGIIDCKRYKLLGGQP